jgi:diguanylate cyclase (GGDEF)-like protein
MQQRIGELEIELSAVTGRAHVFEASARATAVLAKTNSIDDAISALLDSISRLGFRRVIYFDLSESGLILRSLLDESPRMAGYATVAAPLLRPGEVRSAFQNGVRIGRPDDLSAPLADSRGWYVFAPICTDDRQYGFVYADDHAQLRPEKLQAELFAMLADVAAAAFRATEAYQRANRLARCDPLTGLLNRRAFDEKLASLLDFCGSHGKNCALVIIDVDDLKKINDRAGHLSGDATLGQVARALVAASRPGDLVARLAGDEFVVAFADCNDDAARILVRHLSRELRTNGLRCSLGAALSRHGDRAEALLARADIALYAVKNAGKNGFAFAERSRPTDLG